MPANKACELPPGQTEEELALTHFVLATPCACHDAQNSFRWAMGERATDRELLRDVYVSIESLRQSMDLVQAHLPEWVALRL